MFSHHNKGRLQKPWLWRGSFTRYARRQAPGCYDSALTNPGGSSPTSAGGQRAAPLAVAPTLGSRCALQQVAGVAGEVHDIIQVELAAISEAVRRVPWVATGDGYGGRQVHVNKSSLSLGIPY